MRAFTSPSAGERAGERENEKMRENERARVRASEGPVYARRKPYRSLGLSTQSKRAREPRPVRFAPLPMHTARNPAASSLGRNGRRIDPAPIAPAESGPTKSASARTAAGLLFTATRRLDECPGDEWARGAFFSMPSGKSGAAPFFNRRANDDSWRDESAMGCAIGAIGAIVCRFG